MYYHIFRGLIFGGPIFGREFVLVSRVAYIRGVVCVDYIRDFTVDTFPNIIRQRPHSLILPSCYSLVPNKR